MTIPQTVINTDPTPGLPGDFCSANPRGSMLAGPGALIAGANGLTIGRFGWARNDNGQVSNAHPGVPSRYGFVHRNQPALITVWLAQSGNLVQPGLEVTLFDSGDFWMGPFPNGAAIGQKVYVAYADGSVSAAATGAATTATGVTATTTSGSPNLTAVTGGTLVPGQPISGAGIPAGTFIVSVGNGTAVMSANATATGTAVAITQTTNFETRWYVDSAAGAGENAMTSTRG